MCNELTRRLNDCERIIFLLRSCDFDKKQKDIYLDDLEEGVEKVRELTSSQKKE